MTKLQAQVIDPLERWVVTSGAVFRLDKSYIMHFTRNKKNLGAQGGGSSLTLNGIAIKSSSRLKLLGVVLDQRLQSQEQIGNIAKKGFGNLGAKMMNKFEA